MKYVRIENGIVREIIPDYATPPEKWYGVAFASQCVEASDDVQVGWVYDDAGGTFSAPVEDIESTRAAKLSELSAASEAAIVVGCDVTLTDTTVQHFNYDIKDQNNISDMFIAVTLGAISFPYQAENEQCKIYSAADIIKIYIALVSLKTERLTYYHQLKDYVNSLTTIDEINAVTYGQDLTGDYLTNYNTLMASAQEQMNTVIAKVTGTSTT